MSNTFEYLSLDFFAISGAVENDLDNNNGNDADDDCVEPNFNVDDNE